MMKISGFWIGIVLMLAAGFVLAGVADNQFLFFAGYVILQGLIMAVAWNVLGGFTGYVNFGSAGFFAIGAYTAIALHQFAELPLLVLIVIAGIVCGLIGLGTGYLTLRLRGVYFAIATLAMAIVFESLITNWDYVGGSAGAYVITPAEVPFFDSFIEMMFILMLVLSLICVAVSRYLSMSRMGRGLASIRDDETAAECMGVPTLRLKLISTTVMGAMMGVAGAPFPFFVTYINPLSAFDLLIAVNAIAMPMIGGTAVWFGPVIGALLLGTIQQIVTVTISSELNILIVGVVLIAFVALAPRGIVGLFQDFARKRREGGK